MKRDLNSDNEYTPQSRPHPGETLQEKLEEMGMGPKEFALRTGKPEKTIIAIMKGQCSITADMALQFEQVTKIPAHFWLNHQRSYDEYVAREKRKVQVKESVVWSKKFPLSDMIQLGWLKGASTAQEKASELLFFFGFANHKAWDEYYFEKELKIVFSISLMQAKNPYAISAWLRKGELQAAELSVNLYSPEKFEESLTVLKSMSNQHSDKMFSELQRICCDTGVKVVRTAILKNIQVGACSRWINRTPLIQIPENFQDEKFWFSFFKQAGHILLHGKKDVFLEQVEYEDRNLLKEREAEYFSKIQLGVK